MSEIGRLWFYLLEQKPSTTLLDTLDCTYDCVIMHTTLYKETIKSMCVTIPDLSNANLLSKHFLFAVYCSVKCLWIKAVDVYGPVGRKNIFRPTELGGNPLRQE